MLINEITEGTRCWKGYTKKGTKRMFGKTVPNCVKNEDSNPEQRIDDKEFKSTLSKKDQKFMKRFDKNQHSQSDPFHAMKQADGEPEPHSDRHDPEKQLSKAQTSKKTIAMLDTLSDLEKEVIMLRFGIGGRGQDYTLEQVGKIVGLNREEVRQVEAKALRKLRHPERSGDLSDTIREDLKAWFGKGKKGGAGGGGWDAYNTKGERVGKCGDTKSKAKPKCLSKSKAASLRSKGGKKAIGSAVSKKRREDPNKNRKGKAKNVSNTKGK